MNQETPYFIYKPKLVPETYFDKLYEEIKDKVKTNGSRKSCVYNLHNIKLNTNYSVPVYNYSEINLSLEEIRTIIEKYTNEIYDYVLVHIYETGKSTIGYHADKEALNSTIASVSLGASRKFRLKEIGKKTNWDYEFTLNSGDLFLMKKPLLENNFIGCQNKYLHTIPAENKVKERRINLTFRQYEV